MSDVGMSDKVSDANENPYARALERLRVKGWCKYKSGTEEGPNCVSGALAYVTNDNVLLDKRLEFVSRIVEELYPSEWGWTTVPTFNDRSDITFEDVEVVLEKAAVRWEEGARCARALDAYDEEEDEE